jgi:predicted RNA-binding protein with PUA-like domain
MIGRRLIGGFPCPVVGNLAARRGGAGRGTLEEDPVGSWLFKEEPEAYSFEDLVRDGKTVWDGVTNNLARQNLRQVREGDRVFFYQTGKVKAVVGEMRVVKGPHPASEEDPKSVVVEVAPVRALAKPVPLARIKEDALLAEWDLVRLPRLSVLAVNDGQWRRVEELSRSVQ